MLHAIILKETSILRFVVFAELTGNVECFVGYPRFILKNILLKLSRWTQRCLQKLRRQGQLHRMC